MVLMLWKNANFHAILSLCSWSYLLEFYNWLLINDLGILFNWWPLEIFLINKLYEQCCDYTSKCANAQNLLEVALRLLPRIFGSATQKWVLQYYHTIEAFVALIVLNRHQFTLFVYPFYDVCMFMLMGDCETPCVIPFAPVVYCPL